MTEDNTKKEVSILNISLWLTMGFMLVSVIIAVLSDSQTMMLDGIYGVVDVILYLFAIFVARKICEPPNEQYHFGYAKFEPFMTALQGVLIMSICIASIMSSIQDIAHPDPMDNQYIVIIYALISCFICVGFGKYMRTVAGKWHSAILMVDSEFWIQSGVISGIIFIAFGLVVFMSKTTLAIYANYVDPVLCILFSLFLLTKPLGIIKESFFDLVDATPRKDLTATVKNFISESNNKYSLAGVNWVKIRKAGRKVFTIVSFGTDDSNSMKDLEAIRLGIADDASRLGQAVELTILFNHVLLPDSNRDNSLKTGVKKFKPPLASATTMVILLCFFPASAFPAEEILPADCLVVHGRVYTSAPKMPWVEAVAIRGGIVQALGPDQQIKTYLGPNTAVIDLNGRMAMPGIIDSHTHFLLGSRGLSWAQLDDVHSAGEMKKRIRDYARKNPGESWVRGAGWTYDSFSPAALPTKGLLDEAVPDRPAAMESCDRHSYWVNSKALSLAHITRDTPDPQENGIVTGQIVRDPKTGEPTGVLKEAAMKLMRTVMANPSREDDLARLSDGIAHANRHGVTAIVNASGDIREMELYDELRRGGKLTIRMKTALGEIAGARHLLTAETLATFEEARRRFHDDWVSAGLVKFFLDGVVETHTAAMLKPYSDDPSQVGCTNYAKEEFNAIVAELDRRGFQIMTHAIGDAAVRMALNAYESAEKENGPRDRRFRIEHIEILDSADLSRFNKLGVIASMQPLHIAAGADSERWRKNVGPERLQEGFVWYDLASSGARLVLGSDWPIVTLDAFAAMQTGLTRQTIEGDPKGGWFPAQRLALDQALAGYTSQAAYAAFLEDRIGTLEPGKRADIIVLSQNLFEIPACEIGKTKVMLTMVNGKVVWRDGL